MTKYPERTVDDKIAALVPEVNETLRMELRQALATLRDAGNAPGAIVSVSRLIEGPHGLLGCIASVRGDRLKGDTLKEQTEELTKKGLVPSEIASDLDWIRVQANKARHNVEKVKLTVDEAETALNHILRVVKWFYCQYEHGPRLATIYSAETVPPLTAQATVTQMLQVFLRAQQATDEQVHRQQAELERLRAQQAAAQRRSELVRERVVGPVPSSVVQYFKDRVPELRSLREQLADERLRLVLVCGRGGMGKTALITKLLHDVQQDFTLRLDTATFEVDSIVYVALRQSESRSPDRIIELICRTLEPEAAAELRAKWQEKASLADKLEFLFRRILGTRRCLIVLDNFEDVLDQENRIHDEFTDLREFVEKCLEYDHGARLLATSRRTLVLSSPELEGRVGGRRAELPLDEGLPEADAVALLHDLDTDGRLGIKDAPDKTLRDVVRRCHGIPRTLEALVGTLRQRRTWTLAQLLNDQAAFARLTDNPARELYGSLSPEERLAVQALALYDRSVPAAAVRYLLPALPVDEILDALVRNYAVDYDRDRFSLHPLDQQYTYRQIPDADGDYAKSALHTHAARFFRELRKPQAEWKKIDDLEPQLQEFHHLVRAGLYDRACSLLDDIDDDYLSNWGYYALIVELRSQIAAPLTDRRLQEINWGSLAWSLQQLGEVQRAIDLYALALASSRERGKKWAIGASLTGLGLAFEDLMEKQKAIEHFEQALAVAKETDHRQAEGINLSSLGFCYAELGEMQKAIKYCEQALAIAKETGNRQQEGNRLCHLGLVYVAMGEMPKAIEHYQQALKIFQEISYRRNEGNCLGVLGDAAVQLGNFEESIRCYQDALAIDQGIGYKSGVSRRLQGLGYAHHYLGKLADARRYYEEAFALDMQKTNYSCAVRLGILSLEEGKVEEAQGHFACGITLCRRFLEKTPRLYGSLYELALAQLGSGQPDEALATYRQALEVCSAKGVVQGALRNLELLERSSKPVVALPEAIALLNGAINRG